MRISDTYSEGTNFSEMQREGLLFCYGSIRYLILALSFLLLTSLFANIVVFNLAALYDEKTLLPEHFQSGAINSRLLKI